MILGFFGLLDYFKKKLCAAVKGTIGAKAIHTPPKTWTVWLTKPCWPAPAQPQNLAWNWLFDTGRVHGPWRHQKRAPCSHPGHSWGRLGALFSLQNKIEIFLKKIQYQWTHVFKILREFDTLYEYYGHFYQDILSAIPISYFMPILIALLHL